MNEPLFTLRTEQGGSRRAFVEMADQWRRTPAVSQADPTPATAPERSRLPAGPMGQIRAWFGRQRPAPS